MSASGAGKSAGSLVSNSRWNVVAFGVGLAAQFVVIPFIVRWIGMDAFGIAALVLAICAPMTLVGTVLAQALIREISSSEASGDARVHTDIATAALRLCLLACALGAVVLMALGPTIAQALLRGAEVTDELRTALLIATLGSVAQQIALLLQGLSAARQDYRTIAWITLVTTLASAATTLGFSWIRPDAVGYLLGLSAGFGVTSLVWLIKCRHAIAWRGLLSGSSPDKTRALLHFGKWQGVAQLAGVLGNQVDRYALGAMASAAAVGQYTVANRLQEAAYIGIIKASEVLFPRFGSLANQNIEQRLAFFMKASWVAGLLSAAMLAPMAALATGVLSLWVGPAAAQGADQMLFVLVLAGVIGSASNVFSYYAMGIGRNAPVATISVLFSVLTIPLTIVSIGLWGPQAAGVGLLLASVIRVGASMVLTKRLFFPELSWNGLLVSTALPAVIGIGVAFGGREVLGHQPAAWSGIVVSYAILSATVVIFGLLASCTSGVGRCMVTGLAQSFKEHRP